MITLPTEIDTENIDDLKAGFQQPFEIKNETEDRYKTEIAGIEFFTPVTEEHFEHYYISSKGRIYNSNFAKFLYSKNLDSAGYPSIGLNKNNKKYRFLIHRLVAQAFIENPENKEQVNHIDGDKTNNSINNLEWSTRSENMRHAWENGLNKGRTKKGNNGLMKEIIEQRKAGLTYIEIADNTGVSNSTIYRCCKEAGLVTMTNLSASEQLTESQLQLRATIEQLNASIEENNKVLDELKEVLARQV